MEDKITPSFIEAFKTYRSEIRKEDFPKAFWGYQWDAVSQQMYSEFIMDYPYCKNKFDKKLFKEALAYHLQGRTVLAFLDPASTTPFTEHNFYLALTKIREIQRRMRNWSVPKKFSADIEVKN